MLLRLGTNGFSNVGGRTWIFSLSGASLRLVNHGCCKQSFTPGRSSDFGAIKLLMNVYPFALISLASRTSVGKEKLPATYWPRLCGFLKRVSPVSIRNAMTPKDQISTAFVYESFNSSPGGRKPRTSGAAKAGVPVWVRKAVTPSVARLLMPKSAILTHQSGPLDAIRIFCISRVASAYH